MAVRPLSEVASHPAGASPSKCYYYYRVENTDVTVYLFTWPEKMISQIHHRRVTDATEFSQKTVIIVKTRSLVQWTEVLLFLSASSDLTVAAMEHVGRDSTIYAGYDTPEFVPRHATDLLIWLVEHGIHPTIFATDLASFDLADLASLAGASIELYFKPDTPAGMPDGSEQGGTAEDQESFQQWWESLSFDWEKPPMMYRIHPNEIAARLDLFTEPVIVEEPSLYRKMCARMSNALLNLPVVSDEVLNEIVSHRSLFANELEEEWKRNNAIQVREVSQATGE
jgi:hypothetical protein